MNDHFDAASLIVIIVTFTLFVAALFTKGFTHDLLLEAGVFLVSAKLIIMAYKSSIHEKRVERDLEEIKEMVKGSAGRDLEGIK